MVAQDLLSDFRSVARGVRQRKGQSSAAGQDILPRSKPLSPFTVRAREIAQSVVQLREFLARHRKDYIDAHWHISSQRSEMSDEERDSIDLEVSKCVTAATESITALSNSLATTEQGQEAEHKRSVIALLRESLNRVGLIYAEQRAVRVEKAMEQRDLVRNAENLLRQETDEKKQKGPSKVETVVVAAQEGEEDDGLTADERQMLAMENETLFNALDSKLEHVRSIESQMVEIARLQQTFTQHIVEQANDIETVQQTMVEATENVFQGNQQLQKALKNSAEMRVWILVFLVMASFILLFLDWY